ncbi:MAG TPA: tetratricopeptide repeat protein [Pelobium sp.]|nr:tetratricopeptide repeat protein [Pelobium sp.]
MRYKILILIILCSFCAKGFKKETIENGIKPGEQTAKALNKKAYDIRLTDPKQTITFGKQAYKIATKLNLVKEIAEANRVIGIGFYYMTERDSALNRYLISMKQFQQIHDELGEAKVLNNIGNLWTEIDYDITLGYYQKVLKIAKKYNKKDLIAGSYMNIGNTYYRKKQYNTALKHYELSNRLFIEINNPTGVILSLQNMGVMCYYLNNLEQAEKLLLDAHKMAKEHELHNVIAGMNMTLSSIYIKKNNFKKAEEYIKEGIALAKLTDDKKKIYDLIYTSYELETKRKNYKKALHYLRKINLLDSTNYTKTTTSNINLIQKTLNQEQIQRENELTIQAQRNAKKLAFAVGAVAVLCFFVIFLLVKSNKRSKSSNQKLMALNEEVVKQKNNVDRINQQLEELIAERTKDLIIKNQKLSEYSSHLSHQIRGPVATLKGLMMLVEDKLVDSNEVSPQIKKCVDDIDEKIMNINEALHDSSKEGLS